MSPARKAAEEENPLSPEALKKRNQAQEEVLQDYLKQIRDLQDKLKTAETASRGNKELLSKNKTLETELDMYRALIKGWPKGRKLVKLLTRDPYDY